MIKRANRGFSLVEVMVAVFVLSIAMLGIAGLQSTSKRANSESIQRTSATMLAQAVLERIRANSNQLTVYTAAGVGRTLNLDAGDGIPNTDCVNAVCDAATVAMYDLFEFRRALAGVTEMIGGNTAGGLVQATACITGPAAPPGNVTVAIAWRGMTALSNPVANNCGAASGKYDGPGGANAYRRVLFVNTFIN